MELPFMIRKLFKLIKADVSPVVIFFQADSQNYTLNVFFNNAWAIKA